ncbi:unnamed protein product [Angiostrongylus costaricensis]|uniref:LEM domain-containing protein n=1 Tax=Angiostrongylus costaricensis TaxID=334426 RepID=A0A158PD07_ANGCS|nr:unnamed protein product [Angiostrongylus costaricensis]
MKDIASLSDSELRDELVKYNVSVGPILGTTRSLYEKKLFKLIKEGSSKERLDLGSRGLLDLGNTIGNDDDDDDGQESSRYIYTTRTAGPERRSPLRKAWDNLLGYDFKAGKVPGSQYELRHGSTTTRVDRDPRTGRIRVQQHIFSLFFCNISTILMMTLTVFFVLLAIAYVATTIHTISGAIRDTVHFFYTYAIVPCLIILGVFALYFGHKKWTEMKERDEAAFYDLVDRILDIVRESSENGEEYISIPHVRDVMFPPAKRRGAELARWERAVDFINANESRIATETRVLRGGQECDVWRWIPAKRTGWQGSGRL